MRAYGLLAGFVLASCVSGAPAETAFVSGVSLFDGETLTGWRVSEENPGSFRVEDGQIVAHGPRAHLFYDGPEGTDFTNFEFTAQVKTTPGSNSGIFFHTRYQPSGWPVHGLEAQVNTTQSDARKTGSLYAIADVRVYPESEDLPLLGVDTNPFLRRATPPSRDDEWFTYTIRVKDNVASILVDGELLVRWAQPADWPDDTRRLGSGTFALQAHDPDSLVYFKDLSVVELD